VSLVAAGKLTDGVVCLDIVDICTSLRMLLHDGRRAILRKSIERREAGWDLYLAVFVSLNQPSLFRRRGEHHRCNLRYLQGADDLSSTGVKMVNIPKYARECDLDS